MGGKIENSESDIGQISKFFRSDNFDDIPPKIIVLIPKNVVFYFLYFYSEPKLLSYSFGVTLLA